MRRDIRDCALLLFLFYVLNFLVVGIMEGIITVRETLRSGISLEDLSIDNITEVALDGKTIAFLSIVGIIAGSIGFMIRRKGRFFTDLALPAAERLTPGIFIILFVVTQGIQVATSIIATAVEALLPESISIVGSYESAMDVLASPFGALYVVLIGPIFEELIFRGAVMGPLRKYGENFAILFSSLLFGLYHGIALQIPFAFAMGLVLGYACTRWSIRTAIALHIISNGLSVMMSYEAFAIAGGLLLMACGVATLILFFSFRTQLVTRIRAGRPYYGPVTYANGFSSIAFWLFAAAMVGLAAVQLFLGV